MLNAFFPVAAGVTQTLQTGLNGLMTPHVGALGAALAGFAVQLALLVILQYMREHRMAPIGRTPPILYAGGLISGLVIAGNALCVTRLGSAASTSCNVAGQILMSALVDNFGLLGMSRRRVGVRNVPGFALILIGVLTINFWSSAGGAEVRPIYLLIVILCGCGVVIVRAINSRVSDVLGSPVGGSIVNSLSGLAATSILFVALSGSKPDFTGFARVPAVCYLGGALGVVCMLCNIAAYKRTDALHATVFLLIGQVGTGVLLDVFLFRALSMGKCVGVAIVIAGVLIDRRLEN